jgi:outer membrane protein, heavy metal efflux system
MRYTFHPKIAVAAALAATLAGCRSHEPKPLALDDTQRAFLARAVTADSLASFSSGLAQRAADGGFDLSDGISLAEAEAIAIVFNRDLRLARAAAGVTQATAENAGLWRDPTLGVNLAQILSGAMSGDLEAIFSVGFTVPLTGRLESERARAAADLHAELTRVAAEEWRVACDVRRAWARRAALEAELAAARDVLERVGQVVAVVDRLEAAGEIARIEARLFRIEDAKLRAQAAAIEAGLVLATRDVESLLGLPPVTERRFTGGFSDDIEESRSELLARAARTSPAVALAAAQHEAAERRLAHEISQQWPDVEIAPGFGEQDGDRQATVGIGVTLPVFNGNRRGIAEAEAARELARVRAETELERVLGEIVASDERRIAALARGEMVVRTLGPMVDTQYAEAREVARLGEVNTLVLLECLKQQLEAKQELIAARRDASLAAADIAEAAGPAQERQNP